MSTLISIKEYTIKTKSTNYQITAKDISMADVGIWYTTPHSNNRIFVPYSSIEYIVEVQHQPKDNQKDN